MREGRPERRAPGARAALLPAPPPPPPTRPPARGSFPPPARELLASAGAGAGVGGGFSEALPVRPVGEGKARALAPPSEAGGVAGLEPGRRSGPGRGEASPRSPQEPPPSVPPGPRRAGAARTGPPSGSLRARSPAQHDGLGVAAAGTAVPAGAAPARGPAVAPGWGRGREGAAVPEERQPPASPAVCGRSRHCRGRPRSRCLSAARGGGAGTRGGWGRARVIRRPGARRPKGRLGEGGGCGRVCGASGASLAAEPQLAPQV